MAPLLVLLIVIFAGGLYFAVKTLGYGTTPPLGGPETTMALAQQVYYIDPSNPKAEEGRVYLGDLLGVYSIGTKVCQKYTASGSQLNCTQWQQENGWGILLNGSPQLGAGQTGTVVSAIFALIPVVQNGSLTGYKIASLDSSDATMGHVWSQQGTAIYNSLGVEIHLYDASTYPAGPLN